VTAFLSFQEARDLLRDATRAVIDAEKSYETAVSEAADAEGVYRLELAQAFMAQRHDGAAVAEAETQARAAVIVHARERDVTSGLLRLAGERLEDARDTRRSLWRLIEWSMRATTARTESDRAATGWPS
jgi:hypothetical protein